MNVLPAAGPQLGRAVSQTGQLVMMIGNFTILAVVVALCLYSGLARRRWDALAVIVLGGTLCSFVEPLWDRAYQLWFFAEGQTNWYVTYGIHLPIWVLPTYIWFYGGQAYVAYRLAQRGSRATMVKAACAVFVIATAFEITGTHVGTYEYWGDQAFRVAGFPIWISVLNAAVPVITGVVLARAATVLPGVQILALAVLVPACDALVMFGPVAPYLAALNAGASSTVIWVAAIGCSALTVMLLWLALKAMPARAVHTTRAVEPTAEKLVSGTP